MHRTTILVDGARRVRVTVELEPDPIDTDGYEVPEQTGVHERPQLAKTRGPNVIDFPRRVA